MVICNLRAELQMLRNWPDSTLRVTTGKITYHGFVAETIVRIDVFCLDSAVMTRLVPLYP